MVTFLITKAPLVSIAANRSFALQGVFNSVRHNSTFDQLANAFKQEGNQELKANENTSSGNKAAISDIDNLLSNTFEPQHDDKGRTTDYLIHSSLKHPRDVAKSIRLQESRAGRTVEVSYGNISRALGQLNSILRSNKIRYLQKVQLRYIPPAKYQKQKKREWWRRKFSQGFKELMSEVRDAKRRGY